MARMGNYLERDIAILFERIGFDVSTNSKELGFEADIIAKKDKFRILIQTKQYDNSYINVGDLLHQWASKGKHNKVDRTLVVIAGFTIADKYFNLAKNLGVFLWNDAILHKLKKIETNKELYRRIGELLQFEEILEKFRKIDETTLENNVKSYLKEQAILLSPSKFNKNFKTELKRDKEKKEREYKEFQDKLKRIKEKQQREQQTENKRKQEVEKKNKIKKKIKIVITSLIIIICIITLLYFISYEKFKEIELEKSCLTILKENENIIDIKNTKIVNNYNEIKLWLNLNANQTILDKDINLVSEQYPAFVAQILYNKSFNSYTDIMCKKYLDYRCGCRELEEDGLTKGNF